MCNLDHGNKWRVSFTKLRKLQTLSAILFLQQRIAIQIKDILGDNYKVLQILITQLQFQHRVCQMIQLLHLVVLLLKACLMILSRFNILQQKKACLVMMHRILQLILKILHGHLRYLCLKIQELMMNGWIINGGIKRTHI